MNTRIEDEPWYSRNNATPMRPWVWATLPGRSVPVEVVSYPWFDSDKRLWLVNIRRTVGDPTSLATVKARAVACFEPSSHEDWYRPKRYYGDNPTAFLFEDELSS